MNSVSALAGQSRHNNKARGNLKMEGLGIIDIKMAQVTAPFFEFFTHGFRRRKEFFNTSSNATGGKFFFNACRFSGTSTQVIQLGAAHVPFTLDFNGSQ